MGSRIVCAPDTFKGTLTAQAAAEAMARGIMSAGSEIETDRCPIGDGGEGTMHALVAALQGEVVHTRVTGPRGGEIEAGFGWIPDRELAIVELAQAAGLTLLAPEDRDPTQTTTYGVGELIDAAMRRGAQRIIVGVGGSATVDGGCGLAQALGVRFIDHEGNTIDSRITGDDLARIARWEASDQRMPELLVACDVRNPLVGPEGAARVYAPQKGASPDQIESLEEGLERLAATTGIDPQQAGAGAAGGAAFGLCALLGARLHSGIEIVLDAVGFDSRCEGATLVLTGEGRFDRQTDFGKACAGVARAASRHGVPTIMITGCVERSDVESELFQRTISLAERFGLARALAEPAPLLEAVAAAIASELPPADRHA